MPFSSTIPAGYLSVPTVFAGGVDISNVSNLLLKLTTNWSDGTTYSQDIFSPAFTFYVPPVGTLLISPEVLMNIPNPYPPTIGRITAQNAIWLNDGINFYQLKYDQ